MLFSTDKSCSSDLHNISLDLKHCKAVTVVIFPAVALILVVKMPTLSCKRR